ncbi:SDR family NAD(P)-dependent oxidoreductase [Phenylobacterium sp. J367]|uniref:SDR family NAD(P)-dependent oxidoreductase n=1 Tax=Phenylobacterium sp. J367 TaxID=2898435 RepID=UPI0021513211|nr:SDR family oxidoreductase [Phenylobacterium sp. J367]MCR5879279.1 SDR family oxidoreductase [Phenylobacterium sp. J367]
MSRLRGKVAVVTGGALGIGRAIASRMAETGAAVAILDSSDRPAAVVADALVDRGLVSCFWTCDVAREDDVARVMAGVTARFGRLDVLVNNAGVEGANEPTHKLTEAEWDQVQAVNVKGVFLCTKHAVPHLKAAGGGSIINLSSVRGMVGAGVVPSYHASKGAVRLMSKNDAVSYAPDRIRVNVIHPGFIRTPMTEGRLQESGAPGAGRAALAALTPLGRMGEPDDVAWGCVYLASEEARLVTGAELVIDGGYTAR